MKKKKKMVRFWVSSGDDSFMTLVPKGSIHMIGSGEHAIFVRAGMKNDKKYVDDRLNKIIRKEKREERLAKIFKRKNNK